ncbi:MAG: NAD(P)-dependent oxidoreductase [Phycisphaerales bacterium]|nr:NAD(P)-dependent oxidoreductase [Phycisphaerales bacterium]
MKILVTGSSGRLGSASCRRMVSLGHVVMGVDAVPGPADGAWPTVVGSLLDPFLIHRAFDRLGGPPDAVVHLANHTNSMVAPAEVVLRENLSMNSSVIIAAWQAGVRRLVFASSVQAFLGGIEAPMTNLPGPPRVPPKLPIDESVPPRPTNVYGLSKLTTERLLDELTTWDRPAPPAAGPPRLSAVSLRLPYILTQKAFDMTLERRGPADFIWGGPEAFAYIHADDAAEAVRLAAERPIDGHQVIWVAAPDPRPGDSAARIVERFYASVPGSADAAARGSLMNCEKARSVLGWQAAHTLADAAARRAGA